MNKNSGQIFQTNSITRWRNFKWTFRVLLIIALFLIVVMVIALKTGVSPSPVNIQNRARAYENKLDPSNPLTLANSQNKKYKGFKSFLFKKIKEDSIRNIAALQKGNTPQLPFIRAGFYTPWTRKTSLPDIQKNGDKLNTIFPEWFFIDNKTFTMQSRIDSEGLAVMREKGLRIMPMLTNYSSVKRDFDGNLLHEILTDIPKQTAFINNLVDTLSANNFQGINIDFEDITEPTNEPLTNFQKRLYEAMHARNMTVTMDVGVMNDDYDYKKLSDYNDYIVLMAYDQYCDTTAAGPISAQKWIEEALDWTAKRIDSKKIILGVAGYGYDWTKDDENDNKPVVRDLTYMEAINKAKIANVKIDYDDDTYNLHYSYIEEETDDSTGEVTKTPHNIWFTDAATTFNVLRFSDEYPTAGTALWRLGAEDPRIWTFYNTNLSKTALQQHPFDFNSLVSIPYDINQKPTSTGEGELLSILYTPQQGTINLQIDSSDLLISEQDYAVLPSGYVYEKFGEDRTPMGPGHKMILTFDDGPSAEFTPKILDILEKDKIPATFFVIGLNAEQNIPLLQREYKDGYEIGNHTFTHHNIAEMSPERAELEMKATRLLIESITGHSTILFRAPYNADSEPQTYEEIEPIARAKKDNYITVGESIDPNDWEVNVSADTIVARTIRLAESTNASIILLHDAGGNTRKATIEALPRIIDYFTKRGCVFTNISDLMGKTRADVMPALPPSNDSWMRDFNFFFAEATYWSSHILFALFLVGIALSVGRMAVMAFLASIQRQREREAAEVGIASWPNGQLPAVSIIVPAYNEEVNSVRTIQSLLMQDYPNLQIVFVDDGSKDSTFATVSDAFKNNPNVHVYTKENGGKASALNVGVEKATSEFVVCIDADTQLQTDAVSKLMEKFLPPLILKKPFVKVGAVAGNVKVGNEVNMITRWQSIEYITSQNFDRRAFDLLNSITVVPGAIGAFRKDAIIEAGSFTTDTLAEDCDLTMRLHKKGYAVRNCNDALSYTEAPETMTQFMKQRFRWSFGVIQCFWKHRDALFNLEYKNLGMVALPNILIFQIILPFLAPLADLFLLLSLIAAGLGIIPASVDHILLYYFVFTMVDVMGAALAFAFEKEDYRKLIWLIPQRLIYRQLMYYILIKSFNRAIKGELQGWGALKRTGNVKKVSSVAA
jgi:cellulose synthase/poly-beta-1,6-N-acetylglucosamine synthase-like glycosyltransferase/spore germination protein YaaH/peptidoglycan/xylan/chitin deacetylase (PgdA/CDA1 family)